MPIFPATDANIEAAALRLQSGDLVAFPTETVYGLGASALDAGAVAKIYATKGRPSHNPLIVHVTDVEAARQLTTGWNERAAQLAEAFWPGPLTLVLPKIAAIPDAVSAGLPTVAIRVPLAPVAQKLLRAVRIPLAAPSANASGELSPTLGRHVIESLGKQIWVLDGGSCEVGIESTVVDVSGPHTAILRPGSISADQIEAIVGSLVLFSVEDEGAPFPSPGLALRHYAPRARLHLFPTLTDAHFHAVLLGSERKIGVLCFSPTRLKATREIVLPLNPHIYARNLYAALRELDETGVELLLVEAVPSHSAWDAVRDRLERAAEKV